MTEFIGKWTNDEMKFFNGPFASGWSLFKGKHLFTAWKRGNNKIFIHCKKLSALVNWVKLASKKSIDCAACKNRYVNEAPDACWKVECCHCRIKRLMHSEVLTGKIADYDLLNLLVE